MNLAPSNGRRLTAAEVKEAAKGHWIEILVRAGIPEDHLDGKGHPCPICRDGVDRFAAFDDVNERGAVNCRICDTKCGDGLATLQWLFGCEFQEALQFAANSLGMTSDFGVWSPPIVRKIRPSYGSSETPLAVPRQAKGNQAAKRPQPVYGTPGDAEAAILRREPTWRSNGAWDYQDADGRLLFTIVRFDRPELDEKGKPKKEFRPLVVCEGGFKIGGVPKSGRPLYGLPSLKDGGLVFLCEGEKACGALQRLGLVAVTSPFGAKSPERTDWSPLAGKIVVVLPDNDEAGEVYLARVARLLAEIESPPTVRVLRLPNLPEAGDAHDWLEELDSKEPNDLKQELLRMADEAEKYEAPARAQVVTAGLSTERPEFDFALPPAALTGLPGEFVDLILPETEADGPALLVQALVAIGNCLGRTVHFRVGGDVHYPNLFTAIVGKSSLARKGTSWGGVKLLIEDVDREWYDSVGGGLTSGEGLVDAVRDPVVERQTRGKGPGAIAEDVVVDRGVVDKRLLLVESEFGKALRNMQREGNNLSPVIRQAWDGDHVMRSLARSNKSKATDAHISIVAHIVEEELLSLLSASDRWNGFGNRFLWIYSRRSKLLPVGGNPDRVALTKLARRIAETVDRFRGRQVELPFHPDADAFWKEAYEHLNVERSGILGAMTSRSVPQVRRIALIYAALDGAESVRRTHLKASLAVWEYAEASVRHIFGGASGDRQRERLLHAIRNQPGLTKTALYHASGNNLRKDDIERHLVELETAKMIRRESVRGEGSKPTERFYPMGQA